MALYDPQSVIHAGTPPRPGFGRSAAIPQPSTPHRVEITTYSPFPPGKSVS